MRLTVSALILLGIVAITGVVLYLDYGTVAPCGILRERIRQRAVSEGGQLGGFLATAMPDNVLDGLIATQYGPLSPGRCISLLMKGAPEPPRGAPQRPGS
jgi:hypothetical protein